MQLNAQACRVDPLVLWGDDGSLSAFDQNPLAYVGGRVTLAVDAFGFEGELDRGGLRIFNFAVDSAEVPADTSHLIQNLITANPDANFVVGGYASRTGTEEHNMDLSILRAEAVADELIKAGVDPNSIRMLESTRLVLGFFGLLVK